MSKKIAVINDLSGFGRCSLTAAISVISAMGVQPCPLPTAILTARQTGGELTGTLERVASLIRERVRISNKVRALTALGRLQAILIALTPVALLIGLWWINPVMIRAFVTNPIGIALLIVAGIFDVIGFLIIRRIVTIEV